VAALTFEIDESTGAAERVDFVRPAAIRIGPLALLARPNPRERGVELRVVYEECIVLHLDVTGRVHEIHRQVVADGGHANVTSRASR
jgi:hypothetical protein